MFYKSTERADSKESNDGGEIPEHQIPEQMQEGDKALPSGTGPDSTGNAGKQIQQMRTGGHLPCSLLEQTVC